MLGAYNALFGISPPALLKSRDMVLVDDKICIEADDAQFKIIRIHAHRRIQHGVICLSSYVILLSMPVYSFSKRIF